MAEKSIFSRGGNGMTTGGLDSYLGPEAQDFSNLPEHIEDPEKSDDADEMDPAALSEEEAVWKIAEAEKAEAMEKAKSKP